MWPAATRFGPEVFEDWKWSLLSESAMCANHEAVEFLIDKGLDPNMRKEGIVDLMMVAIMNHDPLVAEALFESGYARCHAVVTNNGLTLLHMADNVGFGAFRGLHAEYCAS